LGTIKLTPEMIDSVVVSLRNAFVIGENIPDYVRESGTKFINDCDKWSDEVRNGKPQQPNS
jgi:hypothetical protein